MADERQVWALDKSTGGVLWQQPGLALPQRRRRRGAGRLRGGRRLRRLPALAAPSDGAFAARQRAGGDAIKAAPVVADGSWVVQTTDGELSAWRLQ